MKATFCQAEKPRRNCRRSDTGAGSAVYLNWSFSREAPPSLVVSDTAGEAVETSAQAAEPITDARA